MRIRDAQMQAFSTDMNERFLDRLGAHVERKYPEKTEGLAPEEVRGKVATAVEEARHLGLREEFELREFTEMTTERGQGFLQRPEYAHVHDIFTDRRLEPCERLRRAREALSEPSTPDPFGPDAEKDFAVPPAPALSLGD